MKTKKGEVKTRILKYYLPRIITEEQNFNYNMVKEKELSKIKKQRFYFFSFPLPKI